MALREPCALCGRATGGTPGLCRACRADLPRVLKPCAVCGLSAHPATAGHPPGWYLSGVVAPFQHAFPVRQLVHRLKYQGQRQLGRCLGLLVADAAELPLAADTVLVAMPLHRSRLIERGYNQSFELARSLSAATGRPLRVTGITRQRATLPQARLSHRERAANVRGAFRVTTNLVGKSVVLVDDVITTGATANALAAALLTAGAAQVSVMAVARG